MEIRLIVSGVPKGEKQWGADIHSQYIGTLYSNTDKSVNKRFDICLNNTNGKYYAYYHYMVCNIVSDSSGRDGSYFCLTLCFDKFFQDYKTVYSVLDLLFRKKVENSILLPSAQGGRYSYKYASFEECDEILKDIDEQARNIIGQNASREEFNDIPSKTRTGIKTKLHLEDATPDVVFKCIADNGMCSISSEYPRKKDEEWAKVVKNAEHQGAMSRQGEIDGLMKNKIENEKKINGLSKEQQDLRIENNRLKSENDTLNKKVEKYHHAKHVSEMIEPIVEPINKLAYYFEVRGGHTPHERSFSSYIIKIVKFLIACVVLSSIIWGAWEIHGVNQSISNMESKMDSIIGENTCDTVTIENPVNEEDSSTNSNKQSTTEKDTKADKETSKEKSLDNLN